MRFLLRAGLFAGILGASLLAEDAAPPDTITIPAAKPEDLTPADGLPVAEAMRTWTVSHGDPGSSRYSALVQIDRGNVRRLRVAWTYHSRDGADNIEANPIVVDGVMYGPTPGRAIVALDAATGVEKWRFQTEVPPHPGLQDAPARRGLVYWAGNERHGPRILFSSGYWVYALDPQTGRPLDDFGQKGRTPLPTGGTAVGVVWGNIFVTAGLFGDILGYDIGTGAPLWTFHTVPQPGEFGGDTWKESGHPTGLTKPNRANCWGGLAVDEKRGIVYAAIGAAEPDFIGVNRIGDNLFANCMVALDPRTGRRLWHFQNIRHDIWDLDNPAPPNLVTVTRDGRKVDAVACVTKLGDTLLLDRVSGQPLFPFRLRRAPKSTLLGEVTAPYQPDPELPEPFSSEEFRIDDITNRSAAAHDFVLRQAQAGTHGWFEPPTESVPMLYHSSRGGAEWTGACVDVPTGRLYISSNHLISSATVFRSDERERDPAYPPSEGEKLYLKDCASCHAPNRQGIGMVPSLVGLRHRLTDDEVLALWKTGRSQMPPAPPMTDAEHAALLDYVMRRNQPPSVSGGDQSRAYAALGYRFLNDQDGYPGSKPPWGQLNCLDLNTGKILWRVPLGEYAELTREGMPKTGTENFGGPTVTAGGLVFCAGTKDSRIRAFDKDTGEELWSAALPWAGAAPPSVYDVKGREYVVIAATGGGKIGTPTGDAYVAFALSPTP